MEEQYKTIHDLSVDEREEIFVDIALTLEGAAREALIEGNQQFATLTGDMAEAIRINVDELARDDLDTAERVLAQAASMILQFKASHPHQMISTAIH
jgi:hypothetical protein